MYALNYLLWLLFLCYVFLGPAGLAVIVGVAVFITVIKTGNKYGTHR